MAGFEVTTGVELPLRECLGEGERVMVLVGVEEGQPDRDCERLPVKEGETEGVKEGLPVLDRVTDTEGVGVELRHRDAEGEPEGALEEEGQGVTDMLLHPLLVTLGFRLAETARTDTV